jgi:1,4-dihydroxy-2-naphthoyl-CoA hydrolase
MFMFTYNTAIRLHDTDAAGVIYFANQFRIAHEAFETYIESMRFDLGKLLRTADYLMPIVHAESEYKTPLVVGDKITVQLSLERIGKTSFVLLYRLIKEDGTEAGTVRISHVVIDRGSGQKRSIPDHLRNIIEALT